MSPESRSRDLGPEQRRLASRKKALWTRAKVVQAIRQFFVENKYLEVETPQIIPAPAPEVHIDAIRTDTGFLHTSPELCMKRMLAAGFPRIFQLTKCFRATERGDLHLPEFLLLEWYRAGIDYHDLMEECRELILWIFRALEKEGGLLFQGRTIEVQRPWSKISVKEAFEKHASITLDEAIKRICFDEVMVLEVEPALIHMGPVFMYDYPAPFAALARLKSDQPEFAERFELFIGGLELANGFSELTDMGEQRERFKNECAQRENLGKQRYPLPEKFLESLTFMPNAAGVAIGVDRLVMIFADAARIDDVVAFTPEEL